MYYAKMIKFLCGRIAAFLISLAILSHSSALLENMVYAHCAGHVHDMRYPRNKLPGLPECFTTHCTYILGVLKLSYMCTVH